MNKKICLFSLLFFVIDQLSKFIALKYLDFNTSIQVIPKFFYLTLVKNKGASFSVLSGHVSLLIVFSFLVLFFVLRYINENKMMKKIESFSYSLLLGGLFGNLVDRIFRNGVIDFFDFKIFGYNYPIFNMADIFIVSSVFIIIFLEFRSDKIWFQIKKI